MLKSFLLVSLIILASPSFVYSNALRSALIDGVKFLDEIPEVEWYRVKGRSVVIGWKGIPQVFTRVNRRAAIRSTISTGGEIQVWAVRHNQKKWKAGSGEPHICSVLAKNGRIKTDTCPY